MATLRRLTMAGAVEADIPLDRAELTLGRGQECDVVIGEKLVSRRHAKIVRTAQGGHLLLDEASNIGVMMGDTKVSHRDLREGDVFQIGLTRFQYTLAGARAAKSRARGWTIVAVLAVLVVVGGAVAALLLIGRGDKDSSKPAASSGEMQPLGGSAFARMARELASTVAALNRAEQQVLAHAPSRDAAQLDADLMAVALAALDAGRTARQLADTVAVHDRGPGGAAVWEQYEGAAKAGYVAALTAESARSKLTTEPLVFEALPNIIAGIGALLSSSEVDARWAGAPALTEVPVPAGSAGNTWMATTADTIDVEIKLDPAAVSSPQAREAIAALAVLGADVDRDRVVTAMFAGINVAGVLEEGVKTVKGYVGGKVTQIETQVKTEATQVFVTDFLETAPGKGPIDPDRRAQIEADPPPTVTIVIGRVNRPSDATSMVQIDVSWTSPNSDELTIVCSIPMYGSVETSGKGSGKARVEIKMSSAPAGETLAVSCVARDARGARLGWKDTQVDPLHVPLDAGVQDAAVIADAAPPPAPDAPPARPVDAALGDAWIEPYVKGFEADLIAKRPGDEVAIAIVTADLRTCLHAAVADGRAEAAAKAACARALKEGKEYQPTGGVEVGPAKGWAGSYAGSLTARYTVKGKTRTIPVAQVLTIAQRGTTLVVVDKEGEEVKLTIAADGTATGKMEVEHVTSTVTLTLQGDTVVLSGKFSDDDGGSGTLSGTLTRQ